MRKLFLYGAICAVILFAASSLIPYTGADGFTYKGFPFSYTKTIDTGGLCIGYTDQIGGGCDVRDFPENFINLLKNAVLWVVVSFLLVILVERFRPKKA